MVWELPLTNLLLQILINALQKIGTPDELHLEVESNIQNTGIPAYFNANIGSCIYSTDKDNISYDTTNYLQ